MKTFKGYINYGCLSAEKRAIFTAGNPQPTAKSSEPVEYTVPDGWTLEEAASGEMVVTAPWGWTYELNEVLQGNEYAYFGGIDNNGNVFRKRLEMQKGYDMEKFYWESVGECITQVCEIEAVDWEDAKRKAFPDMSEGDRLAECPPEAVKEYGNYQGYYYIDKDLCSNYAKLERGTWVNLGKGKGEYWEDRAWWFSDADEDFWGGDGLPFDDWRIEEDEE